MLHRQMPTDPHRDTVDIDDRLAPVATPNSPPRTPSPAPNETNYDQAYYDTLSAKFGKTEFLLNNKKDLFSNSTRLLSLIDGVDKFARMKEGADWIDIILSTVLFPFRFYKFLYALVLNKRTDRESLVDQWTTIIKTSMRLILSGIKFALKLGSKFKWFQVVPLVGPILMIISCGRSLIQNVWETGVAIYNRFYGEEQKGDSLEMKQIEASLRARGLDKITNKDPELKRLTELTNAKRGRNEKIYSGFHSLAQNIVGTVGAFLTFTPFAPIGYAILGACAVYSLMDGFEINPVKMLARGMNWISQQAGGQSLFDTEPFSKLRENQVLAKLRLAPRLRTVEIGHSNHSNKGRRRRSSTASMFTSFPSAPQAGKPPENEILPAMNAVPVNPTAKPDTLENSLSRFSSTDDLPATSLNEDSHAVSSPSPLMAFSLMSRATTPLIDPNPSSSPLILCEA